MKFKEAEQVIMLELDIVVRHALYCK